MILTPDRTYSANGLIVKEFLLTKHNDYKIDMPTIKIYGNPLGITIHNTEWINVASNTTPAEQYTRATYYGNMKDVRVHFYVDDVCAWQCLPLDLTGWHAADGSGNGNRRTIAIECIMKGSKNDAVSKKAEENCAKLAAYLLNKFGLKVETSLYTHSHWLNVRQGKTGSIDYLNTTHNSIKNCPIYILPHWDSFKASVKSKMGGGATNTTVEIKDEQPKTIFRVRKSADDAKSQIGAYSTLAAAQKVCKAGYNVYDANGNVVYTTQIIAPSDVDVYYSVYTNNRWLGEIKNYNDKDEDGYAGIENNAVRGLAIKTSKGKILYRVHVKNGGWLSFISQYNKNDWAKGCAGLKTKDIDAIQIKLQDLNEYKVKYRVSNTGSNNYGDWISDETKYAGVFGQTIDKIQIAIEKK